MTIFGRAPFTEEVITCEQADDITESCKQLEGSSVRAPIDRTIAKRR